MRWRRAVRDGWGRVRLLVERTKMLLGKGLQRMKGLKWYLIWRIAWLFTLRRDEEIWTIDYSWKINQPFLEIWEQYTSECETWEPRIKHISLFARLVLKISGTKPNRTVNCDHPNNFQVLGIPSFIRFWRHLLCSRRSASSWTWRKDILKSLNKAVSSLHYYSETKLPRP